MSWLIVPLCLLATVLHACAPPLEAWLWWGTAKLLHPLWGWLHYLADIPGGVWSHPINASQALWLTLATLWGLAPAGWPLRGLAWVLLLPVLWPAGQGQNVVQVYLPQRTSQTVVVLRDGRALYPLVLAPRPRTQQAITHWCQGLYHCPAAVDMAHLRPARQLGRFTVVWQQDWLSIRFRQTELMVVPKASPARLARLVRYAPAAPAVIIFAATRRACAGVAQQLHRAYPRSVLISKNCTGGGLLTAPLTPGFYSTARNGSITIPVS